MMDPGLQKATKIQGLSVKEVILLLKVLLGLGISLEYAPFWHIGIAYMTPIITHISFDQDV